MIILGLSFGYHDSSVSIIKDSEVLYSSAEQHFSRQKHDSSFPHSALKQALDYVGINSGEIDQVVYHEDPYMKFSRVLTSAFAGFPNTRKEFVNSMKTWLGKRLWVLHEISNMSGVPVEKISYLNHHVSHAAQAFLTSGFDQASCLIIDAVGDWSSTSLYDCSWNEEKPVIKKIEDINFPNSLGLIYSSFTAFLGFQPNSDEANLMALAAFGSPIYLEEIENITVNKKTDQIAVDPHFLNFTSFYKQPFTSKFIEKFGQPRTQNSKISFSCFESIDSVDDESKRVADLAASVQLFFQKHSLKYLERLVETTGKTNICLSGGGALNCVNNSFLKNSSACESIYVPPDPGDGGTSFGVALYYSALNSNQPRTKILSNAYLGSPFQNNSQGSNIYKMLEELKVKKLNRYAKHGFENLLSNNWKYKEISSYEDLTTYVAKLLTNDMIVGWVQGRTEIGPRALGNRSILIRPDSTQLALRLSSEVKDRAPYRPYALAMTERAANDILDVETREFKDYRWMQFSAPVKPSIIKAVRAGVHIDHTTRPQICYSNDNPLLFKLLQKYGSASNSPEALINTSFNESGYPIIQNSVDALTVFARTTMDCLVLGSLVIEKEVTDG